MGAYECDRLLGRRRLVVVVVITRVRHLRGEHLPHHRVDRIEADCRLYERVAFRKGEHRGVVLWVQAVRHDGRQPSGASAREHVIDHGQDARVRQVSVNVEEAHGVSRLPNAGPVLSIA